MNSRSLAIKQPLFLLKSLFLKEVTNCDFLTRLAYSLSASAIITLPLLGVHFLCPATKKMDENLPAGRQGKCLARFCFS